MELSKELLKILACPTCRGKVVYARGRLSCAKCKQKFEIEKGVPILFKKEH